MSKEAAGSMKITTPSGVYDVNNMPGKLKAKLMAEGEVKPEEFVTRDNTTGEDLEEVKEEVKHSTKPVTANPYKLGDIVKFNNWVSEVVEVDPVKGVKISKGGNPSKWIHHSKVELVNQEDDNA